MNPNNKAVVSYLVNTYNAIGLYDEAIRTSQNELIYEPTNSHFYRKIAFAYILKNDFGNATLNAQKAIELGSTYAANYYPLTTIHLSLGNYQEALSQFKAALTLRRDNYVHEGLSLAHSFSGDVGSSEKNAKLANSYSKNSFGFSVLGIALFNIKEYDKAIEKFNSAIKIRPDYYLPYKGLGKVYMELGQQEKAIENFEKAIELNDLDEESKILLDEIKK